MKKLFAFFVFAILLTACKNDGKREVILRQSAASTNHIMTVIKSSLWDTKVGNQIRKDFGQHQVGLPQPETLVSMNQIDPSGFNRLVDNARNIMFVSVGNEEKISVVHDKYAKPQTIVYVTAKDELDLKKLIEDKSSEIIKVFKDDEIKFRQSALGRKTLDETKFQTVKDLKVKLTIPSTYRLVKDSIGFLWLRQHLKSGIARGDGTTNILLYSVPLDDETKVADSITAVRDKIGEIHIPGSKEGMHMITEEAYTPHIFDAEIDGHKAYETRGKWEVKGDFMAGPFINYSIVDKPNNRLLVFEGFVYAPSVNKRDFIFDLEAIAKSMKIE